VQPGSPRPRDDGADLMLGQREVTSPDQATVNIACDTAVFIDRRYRYRMLIGGREVVRFRAGQRVEVPITTGPHLIKVMVGKSGSSPSIWVDANRDERIRFRCGLARDPHILRVWKLSHAFPVFKGQVYEVYLQRISVA
jgi:hypothetical protein